MGRAFTPAIPMPESHPTDKLTHVRNGMCVRIFVAALLKIQNTGKKLNIL